MATLGDAPDLSALPTAYRRAMELVMEGASNEEISAQLEVDISAVPALVRLAEAKWEAVSAARAQEGTAVVRGAEVDPDESPIPSDPNGDG